MSFYIVFIILILSIIYISKFVDSKDHPYFGLKIILLMLIALAALRYEVGVDYVTYYNIIDKFQLWAILRMEPLNQVIFFISTYLDSPFFCFAAYAYLTYIFIYKACIRNSISPYFALFIYTSLFYLESLSFIRQAVAMSIGLYAFKYIKEKKIAKYSIWIVISMLFHLSAILLFIAYPIYWRCKLKYTIIAIAGAVFLKNIIFSILNTLNFYAGYIESEIEGGGKLKYLYPLILFSLGCMKKWKFSLEEERLFTITVIALPFPFLFPSHIGMRISNYFLFYLCYLCPLLVKDYTYKTKLCISIICSTIFLIYIGVSSFYTPYIFYWNK